MFTTKKINKDVVAVTYDSTEITLRKSGKVFYGTERPVVIIKDNKIIIDKQIADEFNLSIEIKEGYKGVNYGKEKRPS